MRRPSAGPIRCCALERPAEEGAGQGEDGDHASPRGGAGRRVGGDGASQSSGKERGGACWGRSHASLSVQGGARRGPAFSGPERCLCVCLNVLLATAVLDPGFGVWRGEMAAEVLPSARWLYCGEPDESQRALLGKDCEAGAEFPITSSPSVSVPLQPSTYHIRRVLVPSWAKIPYSLRHYLGFGQGSSVIAPSFWYHLPPG